MRRGHAIRKILRRAARITALAALVLAAPAARACPPQLDAPPPVANGIELGLGATPVNAAVGQGRLTATLSRCGEITSLKWPGPSYDDQLHSLTSNAPEARTLPHAGALDEMGLFAGVAYETDAGPGFTWLRDPDFSHRQVYTRSTSGVVRTESVSPTLGLRITTFGFVLPDRDVLVLEHRVERTPDSPVGEARLVLYANFAPAQERLPFLPITDTGLDYTNDFAAVYDARRDALLHFEPRGGGLGLVDPILRDPPGGPAALAAAVGDLIAGLDQPGVYIAAGARGGNDGFQVGFDDAPVCAHQSAIAERALSALGFPAELIGLGRLLFVCDSVVANPDGPLAACRESRGWTYAAQSAYADALDGALSGSPIAACEANAALAKRLAFRRDRADATFYVAVAGTRDAAFALLDEARDPAQPPALQRSGAEAWWAEALAPARLPDTDDPGILRFARRALASLVTATDAATGAMVASVATQPPYGLDWPRDGAFLNHALDVAGYPEAVTEHNRFYARVQRRAFEPWSLAFSFDCPQDPAARAYPDCVPPGTWEMNYYADPDAVVPGGPISFEIDATGLAVWTLWDHVAFLDDAAERAAYLADVCPAIARGADALTACRDPATGLQCPSNEDDNLELTQGLQGAETALLGVRSGVAAAGDCGFDPAAVAAWEARAAELEAAILASFFVDAAEPHFEGPRRAWVIWPVELLPATDPRMQSHARFLFESSIRPVLERTAQGTGYNAENLIARAKLARALGDAAALAAMEEEVRFFADELTTPGTEHMAEFTVRIDRDLDGDGDAPDYLPTNDVPHVWQQAYLYLAAMDVFGAREDPAPLPCDADGDAHVDSADLSAIFAALGAASSGLLDPRDADESGALTADDLLLCRLRCDQPDCAPPPLPEGCPLLGLEAAVPIAFFLYRRREGRGGGGVVEDGR